MRSRWGLIPVVAAAVGLAVILAADPARPAAGQAPPPLPCGVTYDRTVSPSQIYVDQKVRVKITVAGGNAGACAGASRAADVFFVVDNSITMFENLELIRATRSGLNDFVNQMDFATSKAGLITYAAEESVKVNLSADRTRLLAAIQAMRKEQENDVRGLSAAIRTATQKLDNDGTPGNEKMVIIVVAGPDVNGALVNLPTVTQAAKNAGVKFAFMLWYDATGRGQYESRYTHYVEASSVCADTDAQCTQWGGITGRRWSWPVCDEAVTACSADSTMKSRMAMLITRLLRPIKITRVDVFERMHSGAVFLDSTASPPPTGGTIREPQWAFGAIPAGGLTIEYDARMIYADETYPVSDLSTLNVVYSDGSPGQRDLPNPDITVLGGAPPTETATARPSPTATRTAAPATATPTATAEATPTASQVPPTATPTATATMPPGRRHIYLPTLLKAWGLD